MTFHSGHMTYHLKESKSYAADNQRDGSWFHKWDVQIKKTTTLNQSNVTYVKDKMVAHQRVVWCELLEKPSSWINAVPGIC